MSCLLGYRVGFRKNEDFKEWTWMNDEGTHRDLRSDKLFFFEEAEGANHTLTICNLDFEADYEVNIEVFNPYGRNWLYRYMDGYGRSIHTPPGSLFFYHYVIPIINPAEPCRDVSVPEPDKFVESTKNSLTVHLGGWQDVNCPTVRFTVEHRWCTSI